MVAKLISSTVGALALALAATGVHASEATTVAERAGFLIGHAQRCGVAQESLERSTKRIDAVIAAFAIDARDREAAQARFAESIAAAALAQLLGDKLPSCAVVRSSFMEFEQHRQPAGLQVGKLARSNRGDLSAPRRVASAGATPNRAAGRTSTGREDLSAGHATKPTLHRIAQRSRGKPPAL